MTFFTSHEIAVVIRIAAEKIPRRSDTMRALVLRFANDQSAATAIEYGLIAAGIAVAIIAVVQGLGTQLNTTFSTVSSALK